MIEFTWGEFSRWAHREGLRFLSNPCNPPSCGFMGCSMNEEPGGSFKDNQRIRLWQIRHAVSVRMEGRVFRQERIDVVACCAWHVWNLPATCTVTPIRGTQKKMFELAAQVLHFSLLERVVPYAPSLRYPLKKQMRRVRPADVTRRILRRALR